MEIKFQDNKLIFDEFPYWKGLQTLPSELIKTSFILEQSNDGLIQQMKSNFLESYVVNSYSEDDYSFATAPPGLSEWANAILRNNLDFIERHISLSDKKNILEIGAGSSYLANILIKQYPIENYWIFDPSIKERSDNSTIKIVKNYFEDASQLSAPADLIISISCLEHVLEPLLFLKTIKASLASDSSVAYISFPDTEKHFLYGDLGALLHEHISYFTKDTAMNLFHQAGLDVCHHEIQQDTLRFIVKKSTDTNISQNKLPQNSDFSNSSHRFIHTIEHAKQKILEDLSLGRMVAIHGACNATFNFIYLAKLEGENQLYIFDGDATKEGCYMSSLDKKILHIDDPLYLEIDKIYIGAMTFYEAIKEDLQKKWDIEPSKIEPLFPR